MYGRERNISMGTNIRAQLSKNNKYWISRHRYYELKHFCLQYPQWKKAYAAIGDLSIQSATWEEWLPKTNRPSDPTGDCAVARVYYWERMIMIEKIAMETDKELRLYILRAVTEDLSFTYLTTKLDMPCGKDMYYDRYRKFFWLLSKERQ